MNNTLTKGTLLGLIGGMALTLAGCGDSTDDNTNNTNTPSIKNITIPTAATAITADNQNLIVNETIDSATGAVSMSSFTLPAALQTQNTAGFSIFDFAQGPVLAALQQGLTQNQGLPTAITLNQTIDCDSGSMSLSIITSDSAGTTLQANDSFSISFNNCVDNTDGTTSNGSMTATMVSGSFESDCATSGTCTDYNLSMSFNDLQITEMGETILIDGGFNLIYASATNTNTVRGDNISMYSSTGQGAHMSNFDIANTLSSSAETTTLSLTLATTRIQGSVQVETLQALVTASGDENPSSGKLKISGANSTLTVTAIDSSSVLLELDEDNDGTIDRSATVLWTDIATAS